MLIAMLNQIEDSQPFRSPVDLEQFPDYLEVVDIPMDLCKFTGTQPVSRCCLNKVILLDAFSYLQLQCLPVRLQQLSANG